MAKSLRGSQSNKSQPDHDGHIQAFLKWSKSPDTFRIGCGGFGDDEKRKYIPLPKLRERLTRRGVEDLLAAVFGNEERTAPDVDVIIRHYLRPFAILLRIGEGSMIYHFVQHQSLKDDRLPLLQEPSEFPSSTQRDIWAAFRQEQWAFCALTLEYSTGLHIQPDEILPIKHKEKIDEGGSSITYKIIIDREYDKLVPLGHTDSDHQHRNTYVLKTYRTAEAQDYYDTERDAYRRLKDDGMPPSNIIGFYGGFVCKETYNIILEYADLGNLDSYMARIPPPSTPQEKVIFWDNFLAVILGLVKIHGEGEDNPDALQILLGWHQDVNPFNILVKSRGAGMYDCDFKLADLGLSHFEKHMSFLRNVSTQDNFGTSAYAAPEARRLDEKLQKCNLNVKQNVDIWSLSCVFSEVATWVNKGWGRLGEYRNRRIDEMEQRTGKREDCFHEGINNVLTAVRQSHDDILASHRANDPITSGVVDNLILDMMLTKEKERPTASVAYAKSQRIIDDAKAKIRHAESPALAATYGDHSRLIGVNSPPRKDPPNFPPNHERHGSGESAHVRRPYAGRKVRDSNCSLSPEDNGRVSYGSSQGSQQYHLDPDYQEKTYERGISIAAHSPASRPASGHNAYPSRRGRRSSSSHDRFSQPQEAHTIFPSIETDGLRQAVNDSDLPGDLSEVNHGAGFNKASRGREMQSRSVQAPPHSASDADQEDRSWGSVRRDTSYAVASKPFTAAASAHVTRNQTRSTPGLGAIVVSEKGKVRTRFPDIPVEEGLSLKRSGHQFPREMELEARDHAFLVDNAASMGPHRNQVEMVLETLWAIVAKHDPDGPDLYITTDMKKLKPKTDYGMLKELKSRPAKDAPDMRHCFAHIIEDYQNQFGKRNLKSKFFHWTTTPSKGPRKLSLYVLTDGVWQAKTDLRQVIRTLVDHLNEHKLTNKQIGIQFIRFGDAERGIKRLEGLDSGLNLNLDLIDTTSANGSVRKMLLGAINDTEDDDADDEENENEMSHEYRNNDATPVGKGKANAPFG